MYILMYNLYMTLHIADPEVANLVSDLAKLKGTTKTEALRILLRQTMAEYEKDSKRSSFREHAMSMVAKARKDGIAPVRKAEMDSFWGMSEEDGD
jgi:hypothetical protein